MPRGRAVGHTIPSRQPVARPPQWLRPAIVALSLLLLTAFTSTEVVDPDTWQHLASGRYLVEHHRFPYPDPFSFTTAMVKPAYAGEEATREFNIKHELVAQVLLYLSYAGGGFAGLILLRCALLAACCALIGIAAWRRTHRFYAALIAGGLTSLVAVHFRGDRPYLFTFVFLAATIAILEQRRWLWTLPPLFLLWANTHGGFVMGWVVLGAYCAEALWLRWRGKAPSDARQLWIVAAISILICGLNPTGFQVIPVMLAYRTSVMQTTLWEWQRPPLWPPSGFSILLAGAAVAMILDRRRVRPADWLLFLAFGAASFMALRNAILAGIVAPLLIVTYLPLNLRLRPAWEYALAIALLAATAVPVLRGDAFQFRAAVWKYPARAADFVQAHHLAAPMFNTWEFGAYLIWRLWPLQHVFIDGRAQSETVYMDYQRIVYGLKAAAEPVSDAYQGLRPRTIDGKSSEELLDRYGIGMILMDGFEFTTGSPYLLLAALADPAQTRWKLVYRDGQAVIFLRDPPADLPQLNSAEAIDAMEAQCQEHLLHEPQTPRCTAGMADVFTRMGDRARAQHWETLAAEYHVPPE